MMAFKKNNPGCNASGGCGCSTCEIAADTFTRADNTNISAGIVAPDTVSSWTESSGAWAIVSNTLQCTSAGIVICDDEHPDADSTMVVQVTFKHDTSGGTCDLIVGLVDSTHYYYVRYKFGTNTIDIRFKNGASDTSLAAASATLAINTTYLAKVCVDPSGAITAYLDGSARKTAGLTAISGLYSGLGASGSGVATFDNFVMSKGYNATNAPDCERCPYGFSSCAACNVGHQPTDRYQVVLQDVCNGNCPDCTNFDGTWICERISECVFQAEMPATYCNCNAITLVFASTQVNIRGSTIGNPLSIAGPIFIKNGVGTTYDCDAAFSGFTYTPNADCFSSGCPATATVTPL